MVLPALILLPDLIYVVLAILSCLFVQLMDRVWGNALHNIIMLEIHYNALHRVNITYIYVYYVLDKLKIVNFKRENRDRE